MAAVGDGRCNDVGGFSNRPPHPRQSVPWCCGNIGIFHVHGLYGIRTKKVREKPKRSVDDRGFGVVGFAFRSPRVSCFVLVELRRAIVLCAHSLTSFSLLILSSWTTIINTTGLECPSIRRYSELELGLTTSRLTALFSCKTLNLTPLNGCF